MDFEGPAVLEWWANSSFVITTSIRVQVTAVPDGWLARADAASADDYWGLFLFGNPYKLRFADGSVFEVGVGDPDESGVFPIWDWEIEGDRPRPCPACGSPLGRIDIQVHTDNTITWRDTCPACGYEFEGAISPGSKTMESRGSNRNPSPWNFVALRRQYVSDRTWFGLGLTLVGLATLSVSRGWLRLALLPLLAFGAVLVWSGAKRALAGNNPAVEETRPPP